MTKHYARLIAVAMLVNGMVGCGGSSSSPTSPTPLAATPTRIIGLSGNLVFGDVTVGS